MGFSHKKINVFLQFHSDDEPIAVGVLALAKEGRSSKIYFEYDAAFMRSGLPLSPYHLPLKKKLFQFSLPQPAFENLPGVFSDSLPDGWGRLLFDRYVRSKGANLSDITALDRLAYAGKTAVGALVYEPAYDKDAEEGRALDLNRIFEETKTVLQGSSDAVLQNLLDMNGSSAGARPKALIGVDKGHENIIHNMKILPKGFIPWLVKFPNHQDGDDAGAIEYIYALMAKQAGLNMPDVHLFSARQGAGFFSVKRFDRDGKKRLHMHSAAGLLHADFRTPSLDYKDIMGLAQFLSKDIREAEKMYRLAVFNVLAHNRDDHGKNFSFLMNEKGEWSVSPAYDLTFSSGPGGEQSTMVMGEGKNPGEEHLRKLGAHFKLAPKTINAIIEQTKSALAQWSNLAKEYGVSCANIALIRAKLP